MVEFDYTPRVAQDTAGLGFVLPLPQRQQGIDVRNANPQTRASQAASMPFYEQASDITSALTGLRDAYIADVQDLNTLVQEGVELGYDARTIDYQDPQSIEVNKRYREVLGRVKAKELELRNAKPLVDAVAKAGGLVNTEAMAFGEIDPFFGADEPIKAFNQGIGSQGYGAEGMTSALLAKEKAEQDINAIYAAQFKKYENNPTMMQSLEDKRRRDISSLQAISKKEAPKPERNELAIYYQKKQIDKQFKDVKEVEDFDSKMQISVAPTNFTVKGADGKSQAVLGLPIVGLGEVIAPKKSSVKTSGGKTEQAAKQEFDRMAVLPMDKNGNAIFEPTATDEIVGFGVFVVGKADLGTGAKKRTVDIYDSYDIISSVANENHKAVSDDRRNKLQSEAQRLNEEYFGKKPAAQPAGKPAAPPAAKGELD